MPRGGRVARSTTERFVWVSDTHGDMVDLEALAVFRVAVKRYKPTIRIHGGDVFDFRWLRRAARDEEKREAIEADVDAGCEFLSWYRPTVVLAGNHDDRLTRSMSSDTGLLRCLCCQLWDRITAASPKSAWHLHKARQPYRLGAVTFVHGFGHGMGALKKHAEVYGNVVMGHTHGIERMSVPRVTQSSTFATGIVGGCLCRLDMEYASTALTPLRWQHGFLWGTYDRRSGAVSIRQASREAWGWECVP